MIRSRDRRGAAATRAAMLLIATLILALVAGCATAPSPGNAYTFSAAGGQNQLLYDPPATRGKVPALAGDSVLEPGRTIGLADYRGQVVVLNVWGSWCGPCRGEADDLERVAAATRPLGVQFLGIDVRDDRQAAADFLRSYQVSYPSIFDPPGRSLLALRGYPRNVVPSTIVLDRQHRVAAVFLRALLAEDLLPVVRRVAAEPPDPPAFPTAPPATAPSAPAPSTPAPSAPGTAPNGPQGPR